MSRARGEHQHPERQGDLRSHLRREQRRQGEARRIRPWKARPRTGTAQRRVAAAAPPIGARIHKAPPAKAPPAKAPPPMATPAKMPPFRLPAASPEVGQPRFQHPPPSTPRDEDVTVDVEDSPTKKARQVAREALETAAASRASGSGGGPVSSEEVRAAKAAAATGTLLARQPPPDIRMRGSAAEVTPPLRPAAVPTTSPTTLQSPGASSGDSPMVGGRARAREAELRAAGGSVSSAPSRPSRYACWNCGEEGHSARDCPNPTRMQGGRRR